MSAHWRRQRRARRAGARHGSLRPRKLPALPDAALAAGQTIALLALGLSAFLHGVVVVTLPDSREPLPAETLHIRLTPPSDAQATAAPSPMPSPMAPPLASPQARPAPPALPSPEAAAPTPAAPTPMPPPPPAAEKPRPIPTPQARPTPVASRPPSPPPTVILPEHRVALGAGPSEVNMDKEAKRTMDQSALGSAESTEKTQPQAGSPEALPRQILTPPHVVRKGKPHPVQRKGKPGAKRAAHEPAPRTHPAPAHRPQHDVASVPADEEGDKPLPKGIGPKRTVAPRPMSSAQPSPQDDARAAFEPGDAAEGSVPKGDSTEPAGKEDGQEGPDTSASPAPTASPQGPDPAADADGFVPLGTYLARQSGGKAPKIVPDWMASNLGISGDIGLRQYMEQVLKVIQSHRVYPEGGKDYRNAEVRVRGAADGLSGRLLQCRVVVSSGDRRVDKAALDTLWNSSPLPPVGTPGVLHFEMTLRFDPNEREGG